MAYPTNPIYKLYNCPITGNLAGVKKQRGDMTICIPIDEANTDYQAYLEWKAIDGNEPEAAD